MFGGECLHQLLQPGDLSTELLNFCGQLLGLMDGAATLMILSGSSASFWMSPVYEVDASASTIRILLGRRWTKSSLKNALSKPAQSLRSCSICVRAV